MNQPNYLDIPTRFPPDGATAYGQDIKGYWLEFNFYNVPVRFRWIPNGQYSMGSDEKEQGRYTDEDQHIVRLTHGFWLAETTVTQALWQAVMEKNPSEFQRIDTSNFPVERIRWTDTQAFIAKLNQQYSDISVRLPWEAEWEYACRAGTESAFNFAGELTLDKLNYRGTWDDYSNWGKGALRSTAEVKSYSSNAWGLYEMHGNVWEWCQDSWQEQLGNGEVIDPWLSKAKKPAEQEVGADRVVRGGSWFNIGGGARSAIRFRGWPDSRYNIGFRLSLGL